MIRHLSPNLTWRPSLLQRAKKSLILLARRLGLPIALLFCSLPAQSQTVKRIDSATETYAAGNFGTLIVGVGNAAGANLCNTDGRFCTFTFDATGALRVAASFSPPALQNVNLTQVGSVVLSGANVVDAGNTAFRVNCVTGCVAGGSFADATAFTFGTTPVSNTSFVVDDVATNTVAENSAGAGRMSTNRIPYFSLHTAAGVEVPFPSALIGGSFKTIDSTLANVFTNAGTLNVSLWDATGAEQKGQKTMANSIPVTIASNQSALSVTATNSFLLDATFTGRINTQGQKAMAASTPVVIASDQSAVPVSGTVSVTGVSTLAEQQAQTTALQLIDNLPVTQGSATSGQSGILAQGAVTTAAPTYTTGQTSPLSLTTAGGLRVDGSGVTQPVSGTVTTTPPSNASTNVTQFGGTNVSTGTGAGGAGIPRVTISNDSSLAANQSMNMAQVGGTNTVTGGVAGSQGVGGLAADGAAATGNPIRVGGKDGSGNNQDLLLDTNGSPAASFVWPNGPPGWLAIDANDSFRCKIWNLAGCQANGVTTDPCEDYKGGISIDYMRADSFGRPTGTKVRSSKIVTIDDDAGASGPASGGASWPFGASASRETSFSDADSPGTNCAITSISTAELVTSCSHGFTNGTKLTLNLTGTNSTPSADGPHQVLIVSSTTYTLLDIDITGAGTAAGNHYYSKTLTSASNPFVVATATDPGSVGKTITCTVGGVVCTSSDRPCQGPKFPQGTLYQGTITAVASTSSATVFPGLHADPAGTGTCRIEPILKADEDGNELGRGWWLPTSSLHYWESEALGAGLGRAGVIDGQTFYECEINRSPLSAAQTFAMHDGGWLGSDYQTTSRHIPLNGTVHRSKADTPGWLRQIVVASPASGDWTYTVPTNVGVRIVSARAVLTASSDAGNRVVSLQADDGGSNIGFSAVSLNTQTLSQAVSYTWAPGLTPQFSTPVLGNMQHYSPLPSGLELTEGMRLRTVTGGLDTTCSPCDAWTAIVLTGYMKIGNGE